MRKILVTWVIVVITVLALTGCGTTTKATSDDSSSSNDTEASIAEKTAWIHSEYVTLNNNVAPDIDYITCEDFDTVAENSLIEIFRGYPFTMSNLVATGNANSLGVFIIEVGSNDDVDNQVFYVTCTEQGKRRSDSIILTK